jgi:hypothetical protein
MGVERRRRTFVLRKARYSTDSRNTVALSTSLAETRGSRVRKALQELTIDARRIFSFAVWPRGFGFFDFV